MPLIELRDIRKTYHLGDVDLPVLRGISLTVERGEYVALMGASGSGKTTLMNLLGCLDQPTSGTYSLDGLEVTELSRASLAGLRSSRIGFVFQTFNLLPRANALENVGMPTAYSVEACPRSQIRQRSHELLRDVGLEEREDHSPAKLSGGEQQRVAIARALINRPTLLLADEPTGNLDSHTGKEILEIFRRLNVEGGLTLIMVTHDPEVARHASRVIRMADGLIVEDPRGSASAAPPAPPADRAAAPAAPHRTRHGFDIAFGAVRIAMQALQRNVLRTMLTTLGVIIGVAAVIAMIEMSDGASTAIQASVTNLGANTLLVLPGAPKRGSARLGEKTESLTPEDAEAIERECPTVVCAAPIVNAGARVVYGNRSWSPIYLVGSTMSFLTARNWADLDLGRTFTDREVASGAKVCLIGQTLVRELFGGRYPVGEEVRVKNVPFTVIGVLSEKGANLLGTDQDDILLAPWTTIKYRVSGGNEDPGRGARGRLPGTGHWLRSETVQQILVKATAPDAIPRATDEISGLLQDRHRLPKGESDFRVYDMAEVSNALRKTIRMISGLGLSIAIVSLIVGGVGIMNIMLVSVTERTREIGLRMAVGADAGDILRQFLVESVVLCLVGGVVGIGVGRATSLFTGSLMGWPTHASLGAAAVAVAVSVVVGVTFGYYPAYMASRMNPIDALRHE